jgi:hypothetical protein
MLHTKSHHREILLPPLFLFSSSTKLKFDPQLQKFTAAFPSLSRGIEVEIAGQKNLSQESRLFKKRREQNGPRVFSAVKRCLPLKTYIHETYFPRRFLVGICSHVFDGASWCCRRETWTCTCTFELRRLYERRQD